MSLVKKMSVKTLVPDLKKLVASEQIKKTTPIVRIIGRATPKRKPVNRIMGLG